MSAVARIALLTVVLLATPAGADERAELNTCKALIEQAATQSPAGQDATAKPDEAKLARCRQIIGEWSLRDSRMSVDENGKPLR